MYVAQDVHAMANLMAQEDQETEGFEDKLVTQRNINWIPQIIEAAKKNRHFCSWSRTPGRKRRRYSSAEKSWHESYTGEIIKFTSCTDSNQ